MTLLEKAIIATISYYDIFDYPLTLMEIWKWLFAEKNSSPFSVADIQETLDNSVYLQPRISAKNGFYFLTGREEIVATRRERYSQSEGKFYKTLRAAKLLRWLPFVRLIAVCNNLAFNNSKATGDIDLFIIVKRNRIWLTRLLITSVLHLARLRRHGYNITNRVCLSFYVTDDSLDLSGLLLKPVDPYFIYWISQLVPIYDRGGTYESFYTANNWLKDYLPNSIKVLPPSRRSVVDNRINKIFYSAAEFILAGWFGKIVESSLRSIQYRLMSRNKNSKLWQGGTAVVVNDKMLKFHEDDRRQLFLSRWQEKMKKPFSNLHL